MALLGSNLPLSDTAQNEAEKQAWLSDVSSQCGADSTSVTFASSPSVGRYQLTDQLLTKVFHVLITDYFVRHLFTDCVRRSHLLRQPALSLRFCHPDLPVESNQHPPLPSDSCSEYRTDATSSRKQLDTLGPSPPLYFFSVCTYV